VGAVIVNRLVAIPPLLVLVSLIVFGGILLLPGDPASAILGEQATPERVEQLRASLHLNDNLVVRYTSWVDQVVHGDLGKSFATQRSITVEIQARLPITGSIAVMASLFALLTGVPGGILAAVLQSRRIDRLTSSTTSIAMAIPSFWLGTVLVAVFAVELRWLPASGFKPFADAPGEWLRHMILPAVTLGLLPGAELARQLRAGLIAVANQPYIRMAWAKGLSAPAVIGKHALRNAAAPAITIFGLRTGHLFAGAAIVEDIFGIPGLGKFTLDAISNRDIPAIQGIVLVSAVIIVLANLVVDILIATINPKARVQ
jgi:peptide/nickel transport system permease protein